MEKKSLTPCDYAVVAGWFQKQRRFGAGGICRNEGYRFREGRDALRARRSMNATFEAQEAAVKFDQPEYRAVISKAPKTVL